MASRAREELMAAINMSAVVAIGLHDPLAF